MNDDTVIEMMETVDRLHAVAVSLEAAAARIAEQQEVVGRITATVENHPSESAREVELESQLAEAQAKIAELTAAADAHVAGRKTLPVGMATMLAKQGVTVESMEASALDGALASLSIEQRIAVKAELMRAGLL